MEAGGGLAAVAYAPSEVSVNGVTITEETDYPFRDRVRLRFTGTRRFPLELRIPGWAAKASVTVNGQAQEGVRPGEFFRVEREWRAGDVVELVFPMETRASAWPTGGIVVNRGPLVFSLRIAETWRKLKQTGPAPDWEVYPASPWNYGLTPGQVFNVEERPVPRQPFSPEGAPVLLKAKGRRLPGWMLVNDSAAPPPRALEPSRYPEEELTLIPYGAAKLRVTVFPQAVAATPR